MDLSIFSDYPALALNYFPFHKDNEKLNVKYSVFSEPWYFYPYIHPWVGGIKQPLWRNRIQREYKSLIDERVSTSFFVSLSNYPTLFKRKNVYFLFKEIENFQFYDDCQLRGQNIFGGSLRWAIFLAIFMGFKKIILVGCDYTHREALAHHWYEFGKSFFHQLPDYNKEFFEVAMRYASIETITLKGGGSVLPSKVYAGTLNYKENSELTTSQKLELLSSYPGYRVFHNEAGLKATD